MMETLKINSEKSLRKRILKAGAFFLLFMVLFTVQSIAEVNVEEAQEKAARNEFISWLAMGGGIAVVLFIAVSTALKGRKKSTKSEEPKPIIHRPFKHKHDHQHGRRGTQMRRR